MPVSKYDPSGTTIFPSNILLKTVLPALTMSAVIAACTFPVELNCCLQDFYILREKKKFPGENSE
jgi:hypothetical protein